MGGLAALFTTEEPTLAAFEDITDEEVLLESPRPLESTQAGSVGHEVASASTATSTATDNHSSSPMETGPTRNDLHLPGGQLYSRGPGLSEGRQVEYGPFSDVGLTEAAVPGATAAWGR